MSFLTSDLTKIRILIILSLLPLILIGTLLAGDGEYEDPIRPGVVVFKLLPDFQAELPAGGAERLGIDEVDRFMEDISATRVERKFPHCLPPKPGGADLTRIYNLYFPSSLDPVKVSTDLARLAAVEFAEPWYIPMIFLEHNDPDRERQYALNLLEANAAHDISTGSPDVVIAITDNGMDMDHPDLVGNLWVNPGEDLNGNGEIDNDENNGRDDDDNGEVDDFHGWDFAQDDNNPEDNANHGHGTHVGGIASAVTNNEIGISSVAYSCAIMVVRAGSGQQIPYGYESIEYAARTGAEVINCSWGGRQGNQAGRLVVEYAHEQDALVVAACGNSGNTMRMYPAAFETVVAVAATNSADLKAGFSTYGDWVDISAPGVDIYSCFLDGGYRSWEGTSMASPYVASVAGLIRSEYPDLNALATRLYLLNGVNDISEQNPRYEGQLGSGRVNALRALRAIEYPVLEVNNFILSGDDNGNDKIDVGERVEFTVTLANFGHDAGNIVAILTTEDETIEMVEGEIVFPDIATGENYTNDQNPFIFDVYDDIIPHTTTLRLQITAQPGDIEIIEEYQVLIGHPAILIVDDDDGAEYEELYGQTVESLGLGYLRWDVLNESYPNWQVLLDHAIVIWVTGNAFPPLSNEERWAIQQAIAGQGNILLIGKYISDMMENQAFLRQNFGAITHSDSVTAKYAMGMSGERPVPTDVQVMLGNPYQEPNDSTFDGRISPSGSRVRWGADTLMVYMQTDAETLEDTVAGVAGVYWLHDDGAHTVYLGFNLEMCIDWLTPRRSVVAHILDWMTDYRSTPLPDENIPLSFGLAPAFPNPFNARVLLTYTVASAAPYHLTVSDVAGRQVAILGTGLINPGTYTATWNAEHRASGIYFARLSSPGMAPVERRLVLVK